MSGISEKQRMRDALQLTEGNLSSLIGVRFDNGHSEQSSVMVRAMLDWRDAVRRALGHSAPERECICPRCGIRHGLKTYTAKDLW